MGQGVKMAKIRQNYFTILPEIYSGIMKWITKALEVASLSFVLASMLIIMLNYRSLPSQVPHHFNFAGVPNAFGEPKVIWSLPVFGGLFYLLLTIISFFIRSQSGQDGRPLSVLRQVTAMLLQLKVLFTATILYLTIATIRIATGAAARLDTFYLPVFLIFLAGILIFNIFVIFRKSV